MGKVLSVFTPTYNRAYILPKLYDSLCRQACSDFVWLIVDDGSTDDTEKLVQDWIAEGKIEITYCKQPNGGKMRAHNFGVRLCKTPLFACVDSDDYLTDNAAGDIIEFWNTNYHGEGDIAGMIAYRAMVTNGQPPTIVKRFPNLRCSTMFDLCHSYHHQGETLLVFLTEVIRNFPFPEIEGENFITEAVAYDRIDQEFAMLLCDRAFVVCEILDDGYTRNTATLYQKSPKGWALYYNQQCKLWKRRLSFRERVKSLTYYLAMSKIGNVKNAIAESNDKSIRLLLALVLRGFYMKKITRLFHD